MKVSILIDNLTQHDALIAEHGLSLYLETENTRILFDTGQSSAFLQNAGKLGIDLSLVDYLVLSHGHFDHTGGIWEFLEINSRAYLIAKAESLKAKYHSEEYIGIPRDMNLPHDRLLLLDSNRMIGKDFIAVTQIPVSRKSDTHFEDFYTDGKHGRIPDDFEDELFLVHRGELGLSIFTGCSHHGICNILETVRNSMNQKVIRVFGGFHLKNSTEDSVLRIGDFLARQQIEGLITGHCTGYENYELLKEKKIPDLQYGYAGNIYRY